MIKKKKTMYTINFIIIYKINNNTITLTGPCL